MRCYTRDDLFLLLIALGLMEAFFKLAPIVGQPLTNLIMRL